MPRELARLTTTDLAALPRAQTVFFFAVSALEDHGPHLPIGLDLFEATELCRQAAARVESDLLGWTAILLPPAPLGLEGNTSALAITVRAHVLRDYLVDTARALERQGFRHFVCLTGHLGPKHLTAIEEAGKLITRAGFLRRVRQGMGGGMGGGTRTTLVSASSRLVTSAQVKAAPFAPDPLEHGGHRDTSVALALVAQGGAPVSAEYRGLPMIERPSSSWQRLRLRLSRKRSGYWGSPASANAENGARALKDTLDQVFPSLRATWQGANPEYLFRSWYSVLPPNKSFFKAWVLTLTFMALMTLWIYANFTALTGE